MAFYDDELMWTRLTKPLIAPETPEEALALFDEKFLQQVFQKGAEAITRVIDLTEGSKLSPKIERKLKVWLFNYLSRNAKATLLEERGPIHLSPFEQQRSNQSEYYRMHGGAVTPLLHQYLKETYSLSEEGFFLEPIKKDHFPFLTEVIFHGEPFYDISTELQKGFPKQLDVLIDHCKKQDPQGIFGGEFLIKNQSFSLIFSQRNIASYEKSLRQMMIGISAIPEVVSLFHFLIDAGFPMSRLYHLSPTPLFPQQSETKAALPFTIPQPQMTLTALYLELFKKAWPEMNQSIHIRNIIALDRNAKLPLKRKFQEILQEVYLAFEDASYSQILSSKKLPPLLQTLHQAAPPSPLKKTFLATSGMSGYYHAMKSLKELYGKTPKAAFLNTTYFELTFKSLMGKTLEVLTESEMGVSVEDFLAAPPGKWDVLCLDPYPNFVTINPINVPPIEKIIRHHLNHGRLTVALDITSTILHDPLLNRIVQTFDQEIQAGTLHLFFISSLAKFYTGGFDKYSGGFVQTYSAHPLNTLQTSLNNDPLSEEASTFFSLIFQETGEWLTSYFKTIQKNTDEMYRLLLPLQNADHPISLCRKEKTIPFIGLSLKGLGRFLYQQSLTNHQLENTALFLKYFLVAKAMTRDLPLNSRDSFGFPITNLQTSRDTLRLTVGVEDQPLIEE